MRKDSSGYDFRPVREIASDKRLRTSTKIVHILWKLYIRYIDEGFAYVN